MASIKDVIFKRVKRTIDLYYLILDKRQTFRQLIELTLWMYTFKILTAGHIIILLLLQVFRQLSDPQINRANANSVTEEPKPGCEWRIGKENYFLYIQCVVIFFQIILIMSDLVGQKVISFCKIMPGLQAACSRTTLCPRHECNTQQQRVPVEISSEHSSQNDLSYARNESVNTGLDNTENVHLSNRQKANAECNNQECNTQPSMKHLRMGTNSNESMSYCKLLHIENEHIKVGTTTTTQTVETKTRINNKTNVVTQTDEAMDNDRTSVKKFSSQTKPFFDFRYIPRDEPDGQSRSGSTTYVKIVSGTDNQSDNDNITHVTDVNITFPDYRQRYTEDWIDSLDVVIGSDLDGSRDVVSNWSQESSSSESEIDNPDQCSSGEKERYNGPESSNPFLINDLSLDSDDMFSDYRQSNKEDGIDSLDVLIGSYLDGSRDGGSNWSQKSSSSESEIDNADQCSNREEEHYNGTETSNPFLINDLSFDSDDMFGD